MSRPRVRVHICSLFNGDCDEAVNDSGTLNWLWPPARRTNITQTRAMRSATAVPKSSSTSASARSIAEVTPAQVYTFASLTKSGSASTLMFGYWAASRSEKYQWGRWPPLACARDRRCGSTETALHGSTLPRGYRSQPRCSTDAGRVPHDFRKASLLRLQRAAIRRDLLVRQCVSPRGADATGAVHDHASGVEAPVA